MYFDRYLLDIFRIIPIHMVSSTIVVIRINYASFEACINLFEFQLKIQRKKQLIKNHTFILLRTNKCCARFNKILTYMFLKTQLTCMAERVNEDSNLYRRYLHIYQETFLIFQ